MKIKFILPVVFLFCTIFSYAQMGGNSVYSFLDMKYSARIASIGNTFLPLKDNKDISLITTNPANLSPELENAINLNFVNFFGGTNYGSLTYAKSFDKIGNFGGTIQYLNYGKMKETDETSEVLGTFRVSDYVFVIGWGRALDSNFSIGANLKPILSQYKEYTSFGLGVDITGMYHNHKHDFDVVLIAKNIGSQISAYDEERYSMPFEIQAGISKQFKDAPIRVFVMYNNLQKWDLEYKDPTDPKNQENTFEEKKSEPSKFSKFADMSMWHIVPGLEVNIAKRLYIRLGYNYRLRQEMKVTSKLGTVGVSWGVGIKVRGFEINYARQAHHLAGSPNFISVSTNLNQFIK